MYFMPVFGNGCSFTLWMLTVFEFGFKSIPSDKHSINPIHSFVYKRLKIKWSEKKASSTLINVRCKFTINHHRSSLSPYIFESTYAITNIQTVNRCFAYRAIATADIQLILIIFYLICIDIDNDIHLYMPKSQPNFQIIT